MNTAHHDHIGPWPQSAHWLLPKSKEELVAMKVALMRQVHDINAALNSFLPINRLPSELLVLIFRELKELGSQTSAVIGCPWFVVAEVCRAWRSIACSTPSLWTDVDINPSCYVPPTLLEAFFQRAHPMSVSTQFRNVTGLARHIHLIRLHLTQARSLSFVVPSGGADIPHIFKLLTETESMPALDALAVWAGREPGPVVDIVDEDKDKDTPVFTLHVTTQRFPALRELVLSGIALGSVTSIGASLKRLELHDCAARIASFSALVEVLRRSVNLENLTINRYRCGDGVQLTPGPRVPLPVSLRSFRLGQDRARDISTMLSGLLIPMSASVSLEVTLPRSQIPIDIYRLELDEDELPGLAESYLPDDRSCLPILGTIERVNVKSLGATFDIVGFGPQTITISAREVCEAPPVSRIPRELAEVFEEAHLVELVITSLPGHWEISEESWRRMLGHFPSLQRIAVLYVPWAPPGSGVVPRHNFLAALEGGRSVLCPFLEKLGLNLESVAARDSTILHDIVTCLERRQARGRRLTKLHIVVVCESDFGDSEARRLERCKEVLGHLADVVDCEAVGWRQDGYNIESIFA
ncbi:hypothetical protein C8Q77DRAFT_1126426 [Trametes polyzona]|nr:hypothetical protein C8Q77DRAFT_1126426 [Trametes polyzona]